MRLCEREPARRSKPPTTERRPSGKRGGPRCARASSIRSICDAVVHATDSGPARPPSENLPAGRVCASPLEKAVWGGGRRRPPRRRACRANAMRWWSEVGEVTGRRLFPSPRPRSMSIAACAPGRAPPPETRRARVGPRDPSRIAEVRRAFGQCPEDHAIDGGRATSARAHLRCLDLRVAVRYRRDQDGVAVAAGAPGRPPGAKADGRGTG